MNRADVTAAGMMGLAAHGFANGDDLAQSGNLLMESGMSAGAAQALVTQAQVMGARGRPDLKAGYGIVFDGKKGFRNGMDPALGDQSRAKALIMSLNSTTWHPPNLNAFKDVEPRIMDLLNASNKDVSDNERRAIEEQVFSWAGQYSQASGDVKAAASDFIDKYPGLAPKFAEYSRAVDLELKRGGGYLLRKVGVLEVLAVVADQVNR